MTSKGSRPKAKGTGNIQRLLAEGNRHNKAAEAKAKAIGKGTGRGTMPPACPQPLSARSKASACHKHNEAPVHGHILMI